MRGLYRGRLMVASALLMAAALACSMPGGQATSPPPITGPGDFTPTPTQTPSPETPIAATYMPTFTPYVGTSTLPPGAASRTIHAGISDPFFLTYTITAAPGWIDSYTTDPAKTSSTLTIVKDFNALLITQIARDGGRCVFNGTPEEMAEVFDGYVEIKGANVQFRRGSNDGGQTWTVCQLMTRGYSFPTRFGYMIYKMANPPDPGLMDEMDAMVASLTN